jgi:hypothetical protein
MRLLGPTGALLLAAAACSEPETANTAEAPTPLSPQAATPADSTGPIPLSLTINEVMVALVDFAADGVWRPPAQDEPMTDRQWLLAEQDAKNLIASATLITMAGKGDNDAGWVTKEDWRRWSADMLEEAQQALSAIEARDRERLLLVGDRLVETCQECHQQYKPGLPSMGVTRFPIYPKREGQ